MALSDVILRLATAGWRAAREVGAAIVAALALAVAVAPAGAIAQPEDGAPRTAPVARDVAVVRVDGEPLFTLTGVSSYPASRRAAVVASQVQALARDPSFDPRTLRIESEPSVTRILAGATMVVDLYDRDAALEGAAREPLAEAYRIAISEAIDRYRTDRTVESLRAAAWRAAALIALGIVAALLSRRAVRIATGALVRRYERRLASMERDSRALLDAGDFVPALQRLGDTVGWLLAAVAALAAAIAVMELFPWTRSVGRPVVTLLTDPLRTLGAALVGALPDLAFLAVLFVIARYLLRFAFVVALGVRRGTIRARGIDPDWAMPTYKLVRIAIVAFALIVAYPYIPGSHTEAFKGVAIFLSVLFSLGSTGILANALAGYSLLYRRTFKVGDVVRIGTHEGRVREIGQLVTRVSTWKNETVVLPNSLILGSDVLNYTHSARAGDLLLHTTVSIGYDVPWRQVQAMLLEAARRTRDIDDAPPPFVLRKSLDDFYVVYELNGQCRVPDRLPAVYSELHAHILDVFNEHGVQIMSPHFMAQPRDAVVVPRERWHAAPAPAPDEATPPPRSPAA